MSARPAHLPGPRPTPARAVTAVLSALVLVAALAAGVLLRAPSAAAATSPVTDGTFTWGLDNTANAGAYFGGCDFLSAGAAGDTGSSTPWTATTPSPGYAAHDGNVSVEKPDASGSYAAPTWATKCQGPDGTPVTTATNSASRVRITGGTGSVDPAAGTATIQWQGSFTSAFYGGMVYWTATDPKLTVASDGTGALTATLSGYGADMSDPGAWAPLPPTPATLATLTGVAVTDTGITTTPAYRGVGVTVPGGSTPQDRTGADWGSWPQSFVDFQQLTGEGSYWYSSDLGDADKVPLPVAVGYTVTTGGSTGGATPTSAPPTSASPTGTPTTGATSTSTGTGTGTGTGAASCTLADGIRGGSLTWGFKKSFRSYVLSGGGNAITASGGTRVLEQDLALAGKAASGTYLWPYASSPAYRSPTDFTVQYGGSVEFAYPAHHFDVVIARPEVVVKGDGGTLFADVTLTVTGSGAAGGDAREHVALASIDLDGSGPKTGVEGSTLVAHTAIQDTAAFTFDGSAFYRKGQALDDATVLLSGCTGTRTGAAAGSGDSASSGAAGGGTDGGGGGVIPTVRYRPGSLASTGFGPGLMVPLAAALAALLGGTALVAAARKGLRRPRH